MGKTKRRWRMINGTPETCEGMRERRDEGTAGRKTGTSQRTDRITYLYSNITCTPTNRHAHVPTRNLRPVAEHTTTPHHAPATQKTNKRKPKERISIQTTQKLHTTRHRHTKTPEERGNAAGEQVKELKTHLPSSPPTSPRSPSSHPCRARTLRDSRPSS